MKTVEYSVREVKRYVVARYHEETIEGSVNVSAGSETRGEFDNAATAYAVAYALCKAEHDASGEPIDSAAFIYPKDQRPEPVSPEPPLK